VKPTSRTTRRTLQAISPGPEGGSFSDSDFDALDNVLFSWSVNGVDPRLMKLSVTHIVAKMHELEQNHGFMIRSEVWNSAEHRAYTSESTTDTWGGLNAHPELIIEYHYEGSVVPEPATLLSYSRAEVPTKGPRSARAVHRPGNVTAKVEPLPS